MWEYVQAYGRWMVLMALIAVYLYFDKKYDYRVTPAEFTMMSPAVKPDRGRIVRAVSSISELVRGQTIVRFKLQRAWIGESEIKEIFLYSRVVALEGDLVELREGEVWVNGEKLAIPKLVSGEEEEEEVLDTTEPILVPRGHIFVLNDRRPGRDSYELDSRKLGPIPFALVVGKL